MPNFTGSVSRNLNEKFGESPSVLDFGALADGIYLEDGAITTADNTFTSITAAFVTANIGKTICVRGAGAAGVDLVTTIASRNSATSVELTDAASTTVTGAKAWYGTDNTTALQSALTNVQGALGIPVGIYLINGQLDFGPNHRLSGDDRKATIIVQAHPTAYAFSYLSAKTTPAVDINSGIAFEHLTLLAKFGIRFNEQYADIGATEFTKQGFILGPTFKHLAIEGEYGAAMDANYQTSTAPTFDELEGYGVGVALSKVFHAAFTDCMIQYNGIGVLLDNSDLNEVKGGRLAYNARHVHLTGRGSWITVLGSQNQLAYVDAISNQRVAGIYIDTCNFTLIKECYFENYTLSAQFVKSVDCFGTLFQGNRIDNTTQAGVKALSFAPRFGLVVSDNAWNPSSPVSPVEILSTYWSVTYPINAAWRGNTEEMPEPDCPSCLLREYDPYLFTAGNAAEFSGAIAAAWPWRASPTTGRWVLTATNSLIWQPTLQSRAIRRFVIAVTGMKGTGQPYLNIDYVEGVTTYDLYLGFAAITATTEVETVYLTVKLPDAAAGTGYFKIEVANLDASEVERLEILPVTTLFANASGTEKQDNTNFYWDATNKRLGIRHAVPLAPLHIKTPSGENADLYLEAVDWTPAMSWYSGGASIVSRFRYGCGSGIPGFSIRRITTGAGIAGADTDMLVLTGDAGGVGPGVSPQSTWHIRDTAAATKLIVQEGGVQGDNNIQEWWNAASAALAYVSKLGVFHVVSVDNADAIKIQGRAVAATGPSDGQVLTWNAGGTTWLPANLSPAAFGSQTAKYFLAAPNAADGNPTFRAIVASDVPTLNQNTSGSAGTVTSIASHASTELSDSAGLVRGAAALTTDHKVVAVGVDGSLEEIPNQAQNYVYAGLATGGAGAPAFRALVQADQVAMFTDRGDPAAADKTKTDLTLGAWTDWNLSAIVPAGATSVLLRVHIANSGGGAFVKFRKNGQTYEINSSQVFTPSAVDTAVDVVVACDTSQVIEYYIWDVGTWGVIDLTVAGWWK